jgi:hypothetical protein
MRPASLKVAAGAGPIRVHAAGVASVGKIKVRTSFTASPDDPPTVLASDAFGVQAHEGVARGHLDGVVRLPAAGAAGEAIELGMARKRGACGPFRLDARVPVASAPVDRRTSTSAKPPRTVAAGGAVGARGRAERVDGRWVRGSGMHDPLYQRPIRSRYTDPLELVWMATARRLGIRIRRNPHVFSMTDGTGLLELGPRDSLDPDDTAAQMIFHELCHWVTNGLESFHERDWGFPLTDELDWREFGCLRMQAGLADRYGLRRILAPTGIFRQYYDRIPADVFEPLDDSPLEQFAVRTGSEALRRVDGDPWREPVHAALVATRTFRDSVHRFLPDYGTDLEDDALPSLWAQ